MEPSVAAEDSEAAHAERSDAGTHRYLLQALGPPDLDFVMRTGRIKGFQNRDYLLQQGQPGDGIHIILNGVVESTYVGHQHRELLLATWHPGDFVGAPHVLGDHLHSWSARALGRVEALHLDQPAIRRLITLSPAFAIALVGCLGYKGEAYSALAQTLGAQKVGERLALLLLKLCEAGVQDGDGPLLLGRITQANLARMIGATRQSISLALTRLQDDGVISADATTLIVNDLATLRRYAGE